MHNSFVCLGIFFIFIFCNHFSFNLVKARSLLSIFPVQTACTMWYLARWNVPPSVLTSSLATRSKKSNNFSSFLVIAPDALNSFLPSFVTMYTDCTKKGKKISRFNEQVCNHSLRCIKNFTLCKCLNISYWTFYTGFSVIYVISHSIWHVFRSKMRQIMFYDGQSLP